MYDYLVVGAGLYGATFAREAFDRGYSVLVVDKRPHIAGNAYTEELEGIQVHKYGAHIFHTNEKRAWDYVNRFAKFNHFINSPVANYKGALYSLPFNMHTFYDLWGVVTPFEAEQKLAEQRRLAGITNPGNLEEQALSLVGVDIYEKLVKGYTEKQWGRSCSELPAFIMNRLPLRLCYDNNYYDARYQGIPIEGYTGMVQQMLNGIDLRLGVDYLEQKERLDKLAGKIIYTGAIDAYYDYCFGVLEYRSLTWETKVLDEMNYQGTAVMNYTDAATPWTRIIEHKWFTFGKDMHGNILPRTVISKEYSEEWIPGREPYYPVNDEKNQLLYETYREHSLNQKNVIFGGRLGEYRYYDMDAVIMAALELCDRELGN